MPFSISRLFVVPCALALITLVGCGGSNQSASNATSAPASTVAPNTTPAPGATAPAVPTPAPLPTAVITGGQVAAVVNGQKVPTSIFRLLVSLDQHRYASQPGGISAAQVTRTAMNQLVISTLIQQYASAHHISVSGTEIDNNIKRDETTSGGPHALDVKLAQIGLDRSSFKILLGPSLLQQKVANALFPLSSSLRPVAHVRHILISPHQAGAQTQPGQAPPAPRTDAQARALAEKLFQQIKHGGDFAVLAKKYSDDTQSGQQGGYLNGCCSPGQTVPPFDQAAFGLKLHQLAIVHSQFGYHIMEVLSRGKAPLPAQQQQTQQQQRFSTWVTQQQRKAKVQRIARVKKV